MKRSLSRRGFLQTAGAGTVTMWIPNHASGYTATIVSGEVVMRDGTDTGARPGALVRGARSGT